MTILRKIQEIVKEAKRRAILVPSTSRMPMERLEIPFSPDAQERERTLVMTSIPLQPAPELEERPSKRHYERIDCRTRLPFLALPEAFVQVGSLLHFLNHTIDFPGFDFDEVTGELSYRFSFLIDAESLDPFLIAQYVGVAELYLLLFADTIEILAKGEMTFNEFLQQTLEAIPPPTSQE